MNNRGKAEAVIVYVFAAIVIAIIVAVVILLDGNHKCHAAEITTASYYTRASCLREGTSGIMANGKELNDEKLTCASWVYRFGTVLMVTNLANGRTVKVTVTDRGPSKRLYRMGRVIDLSKRAMRELDGIKRGVIQVRVEKI